MEESEMLVSYLDKFVRPELARAFKRGEKTYISEHKHSKTQARRPDEDIRHTRELHVDVRLREAEEAADNEDIQTALEKIESAIGYLVVLHMQTRQKRNFFVATETKEGEIV